jgi:hypothetical protein
MLERCAFALVRVEPDDSAPDPAAASEVSSVEPSSTTMTSAPGIASKLDRTMRSIVGPSLWAGITIEIEGITLAIASSLP